MSRDNVFSLLVEAVGTIRDYGIFLLDEQGRIRTWNLGAQLIEGYSREEILGEHFSRFYTKEDRDRHHPEAELREACETGRYEEEGWRLRKDGSRFWANVVITALRDANGQLLGFSKVTRDLTVKRDLEQALRESEERYRLAIQGVKDYAIFMLDPKGRVATWNDGAARIKGYSEADILGKYFAIFYPEADVRAGKCEYELREASLTGRFEDEGWRVRKDGTQFWANVVITAVRDANRRLLGFSKVTRDLTERKRAEDKLRLAHDELEVRVRERTRDLHVANEQLARREAELREAVQVRDEFLSIASHELKTPITSLKMQLQMLQVKLSKSQPLPADKLEKSIGASLRQVNRLTQLVEDLLDVARAGARKLTFHFERVDLAHLCAEVIERMKPQADAAGNTLLCDASGPVFGSVDRFRLDQVLVNLVANAIKYAPGTRVEVSSRLSGDRILITVKDDGPGIPEKAKARLFERFERGENSSSVGGLGLGLFITREIVHGHHGTIRVESEPGRGATFLVELPAERPGS